MDCCEDPMAMCRVVCPKPCRVSPPKLNTVTLAPSRFHMRNNAESNDGAELLGLMLRQDPSSSPGPYSMGSPPCRTQNPVVQDADFGVDKRLTDESSTDLINNGRHHLGKKQAAATMLLPLHTNQGN